MNKLAMNKFLDMKIYILLLGVLLSVWLMKGEQNSTVEIPHYRVEISQLKAKHPEPSSYPEALALKMSWSLAQYHPPLQIARPETPVRQQHAALNMSFFLSPAQAAETKLPSAAETEKKMNASQSDQRRAEMALNIEKLARPKLELPSGDPFVAKLPPPPPSPPPTAVPPPPAPVAPAFPFTFLGRMIENNDTTLFLTKQDQSYTVKLNDVLEHNYRVDKIDNDQVIFTYLPLNIQQTLYIGRAG